MNVSIPIYVPSDLDDAIDAVLRLKGAPIAGATWVMRQFGVTNNADRPDHYVLVSHLDALKKRERNSEGWRLGGAATHAALAELPTSGPVGALSRAAALSAFPAVRAVATLAGNLGARGFAQADLVPALLAMEADLELRTAAGTTSVTAEAYVEGHHALEPHIVKSADVPGPVGRHSTYERLTIRGGGEYAIASAALSVDLGGDGCVRAARVVFGAIETRPRRCAPAEAELVGHPLGARAARRAGEVAMQCLDPFTDGAASAAYRRQLIPVALERATLRLQEQVR